MEKKDIAKENNISTMEDLAKTGKSYWKFTQSIPGRSVEKQFIKYNKGEIVNAEGTYPWLSFVEEQYLWKYVTYGDTLTKICTSEKNENFWRVKNSEVRLNPDGMDVFETPALLVEENYSLKEVSTIRKIVSTVPEHNCSWLIFWTSDLGYGKFKERLRNFGYEESAEMVNQLELWHKENGVFKRSQFLELIDKYIKTK